MTDEASHRRIIKARAVGEADIHDGNGEDAKPDDSVAAPEPASRGDAPAPDPIVLERLHEAFREGTKMHERRVQYERVMRSSDPSRIALLTEPPGANDIVAWKEKRVVPLLVELGYEHIDRFTHVSVSPAKYPQLADVTTTRDEANEIALTCQLHAHLQALAKIVADLGPTR